MNNILKEMIDYIFIIMRKRKKNETLIWSDSHISLDGWSRCKTSLSFYQHHDYHSLPVSLIRNGY